ncbi:MAG: mechanosensitive ion channel domain-containing protein [Burkholderiaceae bacterium]
MTEGLVQRAGRALVFALGLMAVAVAHGQPAAGATAADRADGPAVLQAMNRDVITFRAWLSGASPAVRVKRAESRLREIAPSEIDLSLRTEPLQLGNSKGIQIMLGGQLLFAVLEGDVDPTIGQTHDALVKQTLANLEDARKAWKDTRAWPLILNGLVRAVLATLGLAALIWGFNRAFRFGIDWLERQRSAEAASHPHATLREFLARFFLRLAQVIKWLLFLVFGYGWATYVLERFPVTEPVGQRLGQFIVDTLTWLGAGLVAGLPGLITVLIVLGVTRAIIDVLGAFFDSVQTGRLRVPYLHPETVGATRRIVTVIAWLLGVAVAYPFIPGSSSDAFKGLSVLLGLVLSLGSTGLVTQAMGGLVVVYSRALRRGDFVRVGDAEGVVSEVGGLATKIVNVRNEEITIPNAVLIGSPIHNYSKLAGTHGTLLTSKVTIGYDAPWRQVHSLLISAAQKTPNVRADPTPYVYQRALSDFYVEYEVFVHIDRAVERVPILSALHASIQDEFNEHGVQIMSPHFFSQPAEPVVVPKAQWFGPPAGGRRDAA